MQLDDILQEKIVVFGNIPLCEIDGCWQVSTDYVQTVRGVAHLCREHFRAYTRALAYPKAQKVGVRCTI